jgi:tRNA(adenine34) deaminase
MSPDENEPPFAPATEDDARFMRLALDQARAALALDEVPIGALVVRGGEVVAGAHNRTRTDKRATAHAELLAVEAATRALGYERLLGCTVYSTVEPCFQCAGALVLARVARVVWGVRDPKFGGSVSLGQVLTDPRLNHRAEITEGVLADEARELLRGFFRAKRAQGFPGPARSDEER